MQPSGYQLSVLQRDSMVLTIFIIVALALMYLRDRQAQPRQLEIASWIVVGGYYVTLVAIAAVL